MSRLVPLLLFLCFCVTLVDSLKGLYFRNEVQNMFQSKNIGTMKNITILIIFYCKQHVILAGESACLSVDFPMPFKEPVDFNMSEGVGPIRDESADLQVFISAFSFLHKIKFHLHVHVPRGSAIVRTEGAIARERRRRTVTSTPRGGFTSSAPRIRRSLMIVGRSLS